MAARSWSRRCGLSSSSSFAGTTSWCVSTPVDRSMRGAFHIPLEIRGVTARDRGVATVESAVGGRVRGALRETPEEQLAAGWIATSLSRSDAPASARRCRRWSKARTSSARSRAIRWISTAARPAVAASSRGTEANRRLPGLQAFANALTS